MSDVSDPTYVPLDCPVCELMMRDMSDISRYYSSRCCTDCWIGFLEPLRKLKSDEGYLPTSSELKAYREKMRTTLENESVKHKRN